MAQSLQYAKALLDDGKYLFRTPKGAKYGVAIHLIVAAGEMNIG